VAMLGGQGLWYVVSKEAETTTTVLAVQGVRKLANPESHS